MKPLAKTRAARGEVSRRVMGLTLGLLSLLSAATSAQSFGPYDWTLAGSADGSGSISAESMHVTGPDVGLGGCTGGADQHATWFQAISPYPAHVSADVHFVSMDRDAWYDYPVAFVDGVVVADCIECNVYEYDLHFDFDVHAGSVLALGVWSLDCGFGPGLADFTGLTVEPKVWDDLGGGIDPQTSWSESGPIPGGGFAQSLDGLPDVDGDGRGDVVVGAPDSTLGTVSILSGADGHTITTIDGPEDLGAAVASAGDMNGDGIPEIVAGAPLNGSDNEGLIAVHDALTGAPLFTMSGTFKAQLGQAVDGAGDVNGDGLADVVIGAAQPFKGTVSVLGGPSGTVLHTFINPGGSAGPTKQFGAAVAGVGDVDGDGTPDILVGASGAQGGVGHAFVFSGATGELLLKIEGPSLGFGGSVAPAGDVDGDGHVDLLIGKPDDLATGASDGRVEVRSGLDGALLLAFDDTTDETIGGAIDGGHDVDLDGIPDFAYVVHTGNESVAVLIRSGSDGALIKELHPKLVAGPYTYYVRTPVAFVPDANPDAGPRLALGDPDLGDAAGKLWTFDDLSSPGAPVLEGAGEVQGDALVAVSLHSAPAGACGVLLVGSWAAKLPVKGGILVPAPAVAIPLCVDATGSLELSARWPAGLPQWTSVWMQAWLPDPAALQGWLASNGLSATQLGP